MSMRKSTLGPFTALLYTYVWIKRMFRLSVEGS